MNRQILAVALCALAATAACGGDAENTDEATSGTATSVGPAASDSPVAATAPAAPAAAPSGALLDPNAATREQLAGLPGMDAALADLLVARRPFADMIAVDKVLATKLSEQQRDTIYARMFRPIDLNKASAQEIELIPGVGGRMRHAFEEYRPYKTIEQFRREIGKYVDKNEVARLEKYVALR